MNEVVITYQNHILCWSASVLCCLAILSLLFVKQQSIECIYQSSTFLPTYTVGILAWLLHGLEINSPAIIYPCAVQLLALTVLLRRIIKLKSR